MGTGSTSQPGSTSLLQKTTGRTPKALAKTARATTQEQGSYEAASLGSSQVHLYAVKIKPCHPQTDGGRRACVCSWKGFSLLGAESLEHVENLLTGVQTLTPASQRHPDKAKHQLPWCKHPILVSFPSFLSPPKVMYKIEFDNKTPSHVNAPQIGPAKVK